MPEKNESGGETASNYLEKIKPKDLIMFSTKTREIIAKNDFNFLENDYDLNIRSTEDENKIRIWGLPYIKIWDPIPLGILSGFVVGGSYNRFIRKRPLLSSIQLHLIVGLVTGISAKICYDQYEKYKIEKELVIWDYVKKHPSDFPEVFNPPTKFKDMLIKWRPNR